MFDNENVNEEIVQPQPDVESTPSVEGENQPETETPTPQEGVNQVEKKIGFGDPEHPDHERFMELMEAKKRTEQQNQQLMEMLQKQQSQQPIQQPVQDPYQDYNLTEEQRQVKEFWKRNQEIARKAAEEAMKPKEDFFKKELEKRDAIIGKMLSTQFLKEHPDIKAGSNEEYQISQKVVNGIPSEDAYRSVMWDKKMAQAQSKSQTKQQQNMQTKKQANVESRSIPQNSGLPKPKKSWDEQMEEELTKEGF